MNQENTPFLFPLKMRENKEEFAILTFSRHDNRENYSPGEITEKIKSSKKIIQKNCPERFLINRQFLYSEPNPKATRYKLKTWQSSRNCLLRSLSFGLKELELHNHFFFASLAHCKTLSVGVIFFTKEVGKIEGIGIDIEEANRKITTNVLKKVTRKGDLMIRNDPLGQWIAKEAIFKSISENDMLTLKDIPLAFDRTHNTLKEVTSSPKPDLISNCNLMEFQIETESLFRIGLAITFNT